MTTDMLLRGGRCVACSTFSTAARDFHSSGRSSTNRLFPRVLSVGSGRFIASSRTETGVNASMRVVAELAQMIDALQGATDEPLSGSASLEELRVLRQQLDRLEAVWLDRVAKVHRSGAANADGYVTTAAFLKHICHFSPGAARDRVDTAIRVQEKPAVAAVFAEGAISYQHAKVITDALEPLPPEIQADAEPVLLEAARQYDPMRLAQIARRLRHIVDPDGQASIDERHRESRWLDISTTFEGLGVLRGVLDAESAEVLRTAIDALSKRAGTLDERTPAQRRADALVDLASRALDSATLPESGGERPHLTVVVDLATLRRESTVPGEFLSLVPIGREAVRRIACDAIVTRATTADHHDGAAAPQIPTWLLDALPPQLRGPTQPLDVGRASRTATPAIRKALAVRDKGCVMPGCGRPPSRCEAHHIVHWIDGGVTALHNMVLLCAFHHHFVHDHGWRITLRTNGEVSVTPPEAVSA